MVLKEGTKSRTSQEVKKFFLVLGGLLVSCGLLIALPIIMVFTAQAFTEQTVVTIIGVVLFIFVVPTISVYSFRNGHLASGLPLQIAWIALGAFGLCLAFGVPSIASNSIMNTSQDRDDDFIQSYYAAQHHLPKDIVTVDKLESSSTLVEALGMKDECGEKNARCYSIINTRDKSVHNVLIHTSPGKVESMREF